MSSGKGFIVRDKNDAIGDGEKLFVSDEQYSKNTAFIRRNDRESDLKLYRALSEKVDEKYHEYCLFDKKSKVLTRKLEPVPQVKLEG